MLKFNSDNFLSMTEKMLASDDKKIYFLSLYSTGNPEWSHTTQETIISVNLTSVVSKLQQGKFLKAHETETSHLPLESVLKMFYLLCEVFPPSHWRDFIR